MLLDIPAQFVFVLCPPLAQHPCLPREQVPESGCAPPELVECHASPTAGRQALIRRMPPSHPWDVDDLLFRPDLVRLSLPQGLYADLRTAEGLSSAGLSPEDALALRADSRAARLASAQRIPGLALPHRGAESSASLAWFSSTRPLPPIEERHRFDAWY